LVGIESDAVSQPTVAAKKLAITSETKPNLMRLALIRVFLESVVQEQL
jgi:hypothetical protein